MAQTDETNAHATGRATVTFIRPGVTPTIVAYDSVRQALDVAIGWLAGYDDRVPFRRRERATVRNERGELVAILRDTDLVMGMNVLRDHESDAHGGAEAGRLCP